MKTFEDSIDIINSQLVKNRNRWALTAINWMNYDDVCQIIRIHLWKKWHLYNQEKALEPWINTIIINQIYNLVRNLYVNHARPCVKCSANEGDNLCSIYQKQCSKCPIYAKWEKSKKYAYDTKLTLSLENHAQEIENKEYQGDVDYDKEIPKFNQKIKNVLKDWEWSVYENIYILKKDDYEYARELVKNPEDKKELAKMVKKIRFNKTSILKKAKILIKQSND